MSGSIENLREKFLKWEEAFDTMGLLKENKVMVSDSKAEILKGKVDPSAKCGQRAVFLTNAKKCEIFENISDGFSVKIQRCVKKSVGVRNFFQFVKFFCDFADKIFNQLLNAWNTANRNPRFD